MNNKLGIQDLAMAMANSYGFDTKTATIFIKTAFEIIEEYVSKDKLVKIKGLGTFKLISVSDRESVNVNTGERIVIAGHTKLTFTPDTSLKDIVNKPFGDFETTILNDGTSTEAMERIPELGTESFDSTSEQEQVLDEPFGDEKLTNNDLNDNIQINDFPTERESSIEVPIEEASKHEQISTLKKDSVEEEKLNDEVLHPDNSMSEEPVMNALDNSKAGELTNPINHKAEENPYYPMAAEQHVQKEENNGNCRLVSWFYMLIILILMVGSYFAGYYRILDMIDISLYFEQIATETKQNNSVQEVVLDTNFIKQQDTLGIDTVSTGCIKQVTGADSTKTSYNDDPAEIAKYFPQVSGGEYWIVGDAGRVHHMQVGETLYKIAKQELGDRNLIHYLIVFNKFEDPNIIHTGDVIRIPKLVKKNAE